MKRTRGVLIVGLLCGFAIAQNLEFTHYLQVSQNPEYPYSITVQNPGTQPLEISTKHNLASLMPVTAGLGRKAVASVFFSPDVASTLVLPANQNDNNTPLHFRLETDAPIGVYNLALEFPGWKPDMHPIALNPTVQTPTKPSVGNQFLYVGVPSNQYRLDGKSLIPAQVNGAVFTLKALEANKAVFAIENLKQNVTLEFETGKPFPGLALIVSDQTVDALTQKFVGKPLWHFGGFKFTCSPASNLTLTYFGNLDSHVRVKRILRLAYPSTLNLAGGFEHDNGAGDFLTSTPMAIQFDQPKGLVKTLVSGSTSNPNTIVTDRSTCETFTMLFADPWQLERLFSLKPASSRVPRSAKSLIGLDRWQMAWVMGFPSTQFGTPGELMKRSVWEYEGFLDPTRIFFQKNRVVKVQSRQMP